MLWWLSLTRQGRGKATHVSPLQLCWRGAGGEVKKHFLSPKPTSLHLCKPHFMNDVFDFSKPIAIGSDHAGYEYKAMIVELLEGKGLALKNFGTDTKDAVDYADFAHPVAGAVESGEAACGILICGSANGVGITANKHQGIRAAICWTNNVAMMARQHNNANIICIPARFVSPPTAEEMVNIFLATSFEGGRHQARVDKIACA